LFSLPNQVIIWVGKRIGLVGFTFTHPSPSAQTRAVWPTSSGHTSSLMLETFATSTTVSSHLSFFSLRKMLLVLSKEAQLSVIVN